MNAAVLAQLTWTSYTRQEVLLNIGYFLGGAVLIVGLFYFLLYKVLLDKRFLPFRAYQISFSLAFLYLLTWATIIFYKFQLLPGWQWRLVFLFAAVLWLLHLGLALSAKE